MNWAARLAKLDPAKRTNAGSAESVFSRQNVAIGTKGTIDIAVFQEDRFNAAGLAHTAAECAAIIDEGHHRNPWAFVPHKLPPSWPAPEYEPTPGATCSCCDQPSWWCEATVPKGWRCGICHPPLGLAADAIRKVLT